MHTVIQNHPIKWIMREWELHPDLTSVPALKA
jgi:hypothetical protein